MLKYTDVYISTLARGLCAPDEQFVAAAAGYYRSFWSFGIPFFMHRYLLIATSVRLIVVDHRKGLIFDRLDRVESHRWEELSMVKLGGLLRKKLVVKDAGNRTLLAMRLSVILSPLARSVAASSAIVQTWQQRRALGAAPVHAALPRVAQPGAPHPASWS